jgi:hypothetical protein
MKECLLRVGMASGNMLNMYPVKSIFTVHDFNIIIPNAEEG